MDKSSVIWVGNGRGRGTAESWNGEWAESRTREVINGGFSIRAASFFVLSLFLRLIELFSAHCGSLCMLYIVI